MLLFFLMSCAIKSYHGLLTLENNTPTIVDIEGQRYALHLGEDASFFSKLDGVVMRVEGPALMRHIMVQDWTVMDAGDGSAPFIGILYRQGVQWMMKDIQSGAELIIEGSAPDWSIDDVVLIIGYVSGTHRIRVVSYRNLGRLSEE